MGRTNRTFRVFISSTFSDLKVERNALQESVYPRLRSLCAEHNCRFQAIDLRWGVSEEAAFDQQTIPVCLQELKRCQGVSPRPNFLILLGNRYGWRPLPAHVAADEFEALLEVSEKAHRRRLLEWYRRDDNAIPAEYCLLPRTGGFLDGDTWSREENVIREALRESLGRLGWPDDDPRRLPYEASATEIEIIHGALQIPDAPEHVHCLFRDIQGLPHARAAGAYIDISDEGVDADAQRRLARLKEALRSRLPGNVYDYTVEWTGESITTKHLEPLCQAVYDRLSGMISREIAQWEGMDPLVQETEAHRAFGRERTQHFIGRAALLEDIRQYIAGPDPHPFVIYGPAGSGKSAVVARAAELAEEEHQGKAEVAIRFVGATPASSDTRSLLEKLCQDISHRYGASDPGNMLDQRQLAKELPKRLALAREGKRLIVFLDALDQLADARDGRGLAWLPRDLTPHVKLVVSVTSSDSPGTQELKSANGGGSDRDHFLSALQRRLRQSRFAQVPVMSAQEADKLLDTWLSEIHRQLQPSQRKAVMSAFSGCSHPLFLRLAFDEASRARSFDPLSMESLTSRSSGIPGILEGLLKRLSEPSRHGDVLVTRALGYLAAARYGLTEDELLDVLSRDEEVMADFRRRSPKSPESANLPVVVWSRLYYDMEPYLAERSGAGGTLMAFYHQQLEMVVRELCQTRGILTELHRRLARYFDEQPLERVQKRQAAAPNTRKVSELPYQLCAAHCWPELERVLSGLGFIEAKAKAGLTFDLVRDFTSGEYAYRQARQAAGAERVSAGLTERFLLYKQFVMLHAHILARDASQTPILAFNYAQDGPVVKEAAGMMSKQLWRKRPWLELLDKPVLNRRPALLHTIDAHEGEVCSVSISGNGSVVASASQDATIRLWDAVTGNPLQTISMAEHGAVAGIALSEEGETLVSADMSGAVCKWNTESGELLFDLKGHTGPALCVAVTPDARYAASGGADGTVRLWDLGSGRALRVLEGHFGEVTSVALQSDAFLAISGGTDWHVRLWDTRQGRTIRCLEGHTVPVQSVAVNAGGTLFMSSSGQPADSGGIVPWALVKAADVRFWDAQGNLLRAVKGHELGQRGGWTMGVLNTIVHGVSLSRDGRTGISAGFDGAVCVWDPARDEPTRKLYGHHGPVLCVSMDAAGSLAVTGGVDRTVRVWRIQGEAPAPPALTRRVGKRGRSAWVGLEERARLTWRNQRLRRWVLAPLLGLLISRLTEPIAASFSVPGGRWLCIATAIFVALWIQIEWRLRWRSHDDAWRRPLLPWILRRVLAVAVAPVSLLLAVVDCPLCGMRIIGRSRLFHCPNCDFRDALR